jgi:hypothetical protein
MIGPENLVGEMMSLRWINASTGVLDLDTELIWGKVKGNRILV